MPRIAASFVLSTRTNARVSRYERTIDPDWLPRVYTRGVRYLVISLLAISALSAAQEQRTFTGVITDDACAGAGHARMRMGPTDAECARACIMFHDAAYVLEDGKNVYNLSDQKAPEKFAGSRVTVTGTLDARSRTIRVDSIAAAK